MLGWLAHHSPSGADHVHNYNWVTTQLQRAQGFKVKASMKEWKPLDWKRVDCTLLDTADQRETVHSLLKVSVPSWMELTTQKIHGQYQRTTVLASALAAECFLFGVQSHAIGT